MNAEPYVLWFFDSDSDDHRGGSSECGNYRTKEAAQARCDQGNAGLLDRKNADAKRHWKARHAEWTKTLKVEDEPTFTPVPLKTTGYGWTQDDHYFISPLEFEDEYDKEEHSAGVESGRALDEIDRLRAEVERRTDLDGWNVHGR